MTKLDTAFLKKYLEDGETVTYVIHKHWVVFASNFIKWFFFGLILIPTLIWLYPGAYLYLLITMLIVLIMAIYDFFVWYLDIVVLSDLNLIHAEWNGLFKSNATRVSYDMIGTVGFENTGVFGSILNYGDLIIHQGGEQLIIKHTKDPKIAEFALIDAKYKFLGMGNSAPEEAPPIDKQGLKDLLTDIVAEHVGEHNIKKKGFRK